MATDSPRGFVRAKSHNGAVCPRQSWYEVSANNPSTIFPGDPVALSGSKVRAYPVGTAASPGVLGICTAVYDSNKRPLTFNQPNSGPFLPASTAGWVMVDDDPDARFIANASGTVAASDVGLFVNIVQSSANTAVGRSGVEINIATATVSASTVALPFRIVNLAANNLDGFVGGENNQDVEVIIADHVWRRTLG